MGDGLLDHDGREHDAVPKSVQAFRHHALAFDEAAALLAPAREAARVVIAVSGGPDSTALLHLAAQVRRAGLLPPLVAATVDHGLNPASHDVAAGVVVTARALGLEAHLLPWIGPKPSTGLQAAARQERYRLLGALAREVGATHLLTAHTLDDQAETVLFRLARGSGPLGLIGMRPAAVRGDLIHLRPLLDIPKSRLVETCGVHGWPFVEDPANRDPRFARARLRRLLPQLGQEGLDARALANLARRLARDDAALAVGAAALLADATVTVAPHRKVLNARDLLVAPAGIALRVLAATVTDFARPGPPRLARTERLLEELAAAQASGRALRRTLHGHIVTLDRRGTVEIVPEGSRRRGRAGPMPPPSGEGEPA